MIALKFWMLIMIPVIGCFEFNFRRPSLSETDSLNGRFLLNAFRKFAPKVFYYQVNPTTLQSLSISPLEKCLSLNGFFIDGSCFLYRTTVLNFEGALSDCNARGGVLWLPNLRDTKLYQKVAEAMQGVLPASNLFGATNQELWLAYRNGFDLKNNPVVNHLVLAAVTNPISPNLCGVLKFTTGSFYFDYRDCSLPRNYVCQVLV